MRGRATSREQAGTELVVLSGGAAAHELLTWCSFRLPRT